VCAVFIKRKKERKEGLDICIEDKKGRFSLFGSKKRC
jgi:hypothetical protein